MATSWPPPPHLLWHQSPASRAAAYASASSRGASPGASAGAAAGPAAGAAVLGLLLCITAAGGRAAGRAAGRDRPSWGTSSPGVHECKPHGPITVLMHLPCMHLLPSPTPLLPDASHLAPPLLPPPTSLPGVHLTYSPFPRCPYMPPPSYHASPLPTRLALSKPSRLQRRCILKL